MLKQVRNRSTNGGTEDLGSGLTRSSNGSSNSNAKTPMLPKSGIRRMYIYIFAAALLFIVIGMWNSMRVDGLGEVTSAHHNTSCRLP
jgi:hypothetical protein